MQWEKVHRSHKLYPLLYPGSNAKMLWDYAVGLSVLVHLIANPLLLGFSDQLGSVLP